MKIKKILVKIGSFGFPWKIKENNNSITASLSCNMAEKILSSILQELFRTKKGRQLFLDACDKSEAGETEGE